VAVQAPLRFFSLFCCSFRATPHEGRRATTVVLGSSLRPHEPQPVLSIARILALDISLLLLKALQMQIMDASTKQAAVLHAAPAPDRGLER